MIKTFKWLWDKAQSYGEERIVARIHSKAEYHRLKSESAILKEKHEPNSEDDREFSMFAGPRLSAEQHSLIQYELIRMLTDYYREQEHVSEAKKHGR